MVGCMTKRIVFVQDLLDSLNVSLDGDVFETSTSVLAPISRWTPPTLHAERITQLFSAPLPRDIPLMVKAAFAPEERQGLRAQAQRPQAYAKVIYLAEITSHGTPGPAMSATFAVMERGEAISGDEWSIDRVYELCDAVAMLHDSPPTTDSHLTDLTTWFQSLLNLTAHEVSLSETTQSYLGRLNHVPEDVVDLLDEPFDDAALHGDVHHGNLLAFAARRRAVNKLIDPKGLIGESLYDYANIMFNPDVTDPRVLELFEERFDTISRHLFDHFGTDLSQRFLRWIRAYGCLSAVWHLEDNQVDQAHAVLEVALAADRRLNLKL